jgi:YgiT-type zinc finger domain-containing protein
VTAGSFTPGTLKEKCGLVRDNPPRKTMKCIVCHGEDVQAREIKEEIRVENDIIYVPLHIPVCRTCGERYYDRGTIRFLEEAEQKLKEDRTGLQEVGKVLMYA